MKILSLAFSNLNSLSGQWKIDFTHPDFVTSGIFAIIGPTGSGKSTILDAICLALYGDTPRLGSITKNNNEIMSRQQANCYAEVVFETAAGQFCVCWSQRRSRDLVTGQLQQQKHEFTDLSTNKPETGIGVVSQRVEEVTGMDFKQFTRSVLLAQGGFSAFLSSSANERAPMLEKLTGKEIYSTISKRVHEKHRGLLEGLKELQLLMDGADLLSEAKKQELEEQKTLFLKQQSTLEKQRTPLLVIVDNAKQQQKLAEQWNLLTAENAEFAKGKEQEENWQKTLKKAESASLIQPLNLQLEQLKVEQKIAQQQIVAIETEIPRKLKEVEKQKTLLQEKQSLEESKIPEWNQLEVTIKKVRELDSTLANLRQQISALQGKYQREKKNYDETLMDIGVKEQFIEDLTLQVSTAQKKLMEHGSDEILEKRLPGLKEKTEQLTQYQEQILEKQDKVDEEKNTLDKLTILSDQQGELAASLTTSEKKIRNKWEKQGVRLAELRGESTNQQLHLQKDDLQERQKHFAKLAEILENQDSLTTQQKSKEEELATLVKEESSIKQQVVKILKEVEEHKGRLKLLRKNQILEAKVLDLTEERNRLVKGDPCPLCGSKEHPWRDDSPPQLSETSQELEQTEAAVLVMENRLIIENTQLQQIQQQIAICQAECKKHGKELIVLEEKRQSQVVLCQWTQPEAPTLLSVLEQISNANAKEKLLQQKLTAILEGEEEERKLRQELDQIEISIKLQTKDAREQEKNLTICKTSYQNLTSELEKLRELTEEKKQAFFQEILGFDSALQSTDSPKQWLGLLEQRSKLWQVMVKQYETLKTKLQDNQTYLTKKIEELVRTSHTKSNLFTELLTLIERSEALTSERQTSFATQDPDEVEEAMKTGKTQLQLEISKGKDLLNKEKISLVEVETQKQNLQTASVERQTKIKKMETLWNTRLAELFTDYQEYENSILGDDEKTKIQQLYDNRIKTGIELTTKCTENRTRFTELTEALKDYPPLEELTIKLEKLDEEYKTTSEEVGGITKILKNEAERIERFGEQFEKAKLLKIETTRWGRLNGLIGSFNGQKFRNFAQGITFEIMIEFANLQLAKMSDRYILVRDQEAPLELLVIDQYQGGILRSTKNLSGGESFIISLSLALGLSSMASKNVRIDSLFLDEGFGTLDEESLDMALSTLSSLNQEGKIIGLISHVSALKERIPAQISLIPTSSGVSKISGPGCSRIT